MKPAIQVDGISKQFRLGARRGEDYRTLREAIVAGVRAPWDRLRRRAPARPSGDEFWALKDVSFDVRPGEVVGLIGRNGSGKSTLLKVLSQIYEPTTGRVVLRGRLASLLEVGTGFHPELTGRENIYLNGSILGMRRAEIDRQFDAIVAFSEIERFLDTPVKRYSSGMYVRLAFAVAAHLEPEILIVDEVLAVGDAQFQKKCLGKMGDVAQSGRTVVFVSHNMPAVHALCTTGVLLKAGRVVQRDAIDPVVRAYLADGLPPEDSSGLNRSRRLADTGECTIADAWIEVDGVRTATVEWRKPFTVGMDVDVAVQITAAPEYLIRDETQQPIVFAPTGLSQGVRHRLDPGRYRVTARCPGLPLASGGYYLDVMMAESGQRFYDGYECGLSFAVEDRPRPPTGWHFRQRRGQGSLPLDVDVTIGRRD
jgi:lipopolysaccharide transport system ATP-binding protein